MSVMHLNEVSSTLTWGSDVLSAACAETAMSRDVSAHSTIEVDTTGRKVIAHPGLRLPPQRCDSPGVAGHWIILDTITGESILTAG